MPSRRRVSRFAEAAAEVEPPTRDEQVTEDERTRRHLANHNVFADSRDVATYRRDLRVAEHAAGVRPDAEVWTGAVSAVVQEVDGWRARWVLVRQAGGHVVRSLHLEPVERETPPGGMTSNLLRELSPARAIAAAAARLAEGFSDRLFWPDKVMQWAGRDADEYGPQNEAPRRGRPGLDRHHKAAVAEAYLAEMARPRVKGQPSVHARLGEMFGRDPETMRDQVRACRRDGFLSPALGPGRKGADPGPELVRYRAGHEKEADR